MQSNIFIGFFSEMIFNLIVVAGSDAQSRLDLISDLSQFLSCAG